ncbi:MAG TPA: FHA domain-containing protein [Acidobacteriota bacterium]|nr:FHA domain-containing protein [Acidobacteriota bacterium]
MIRCSYCGTDNLDGSEYCDECGNKLNIQASASTLHIDPSPAPGAPVGYGAPGMMPVPPSAPPPALQSPVVVPLQAAPVYPMPPASAPPPLPPPPALSPPPPPIPPMPPKALTPPPSMAAPGPIGQPPVPSAFSSAPPPLPPAPSAVPIPQLDHGAPPPTFTPGGGTASSSSSGKTPGRAKLIIQRGGTIGKEFMLTDTESNIGRWDADGGIFPDVDLDQDDPEAKVSRRHARIVHQSGQYLLEDLGSTNGTFINRGRRLLPGSRHALSNGDEIIVGKTFLKFVVE